MRSSVDLPEPERPSRPTISPVAQRQVDVVEHQQLVAGVLVDRTCRHSLDLEQASCAVTMVSMARLPFSPGDRRRSA